MEVYGDFQVNVRRALTEIDEDWEWYVGLVICGSHTPRQTELESLISNIKVCRERRYPFLGICYGFQIAALEYARNVLGIQDATSEEFKAFGTAIVKKRKDGLNVGHKNGESYWNNFEVDLPNWVIPKNFFVTQAHPEYESMIGKPHRLLKDFLKHAREYTRTMAV